MLENLIKILKKEDFNLEEKLIIDFNKSHFPKDSLYSISQLIFESPKINHKTRHIFFIVSALFASLSTTLIILYEDLLDAYKKEGTRFNKLYKTNVKKNTVKN